MNPVQRARGQIKLLQQEVCQVIWATRRHFQPDCLPVGSMLQALA